MQTTDRSDNFHAEFQQLNQRLDKIDQELTVLNVRVDTYQKTSNQVVNLAFGLIATATVTVIATAVLK